MSSVFVLSDHYPLKSSIKSQLTMLNTTEEIFIFENLFLKK